MITDLLRNIMNARFGKDVRQSIHDAIQQCYIDATGHPDSIAAAVRDIEEFKAETTGDINIYKAQINTAVSNRVGRPDYDFDEFTTAVTQGTFPTSASLEYNERVIEDGYIQLLMQSGALLNPSTPGAMSISVEINNVTVYAQNAISLSGNLMITNTYSNLIPVKTGDEVKVVCHGVNAETSEIMIRHCGV